MSQPFGGLVDKARSIFDQIIVKIQIDRDSDKNPHNIAKNVIEIQGTDGNWDYDCYMFGMYNGMVLMYSIFSGEEPEFRDAPETWRAKDLDSEQHLQELSAYRLTVENREATIAELEAKIAKLEVANQGMKYSGGR